MQYGIVAAPIRSHLKGSRDAGKECITAVDQLQDNRAQFVSLPRRNERPMIGRQRSIICGFGGKVHNISRGQLLIWAMSYERSVIGKQRSVICGFGGEKSPATTVRAYCGTEAGIGVTALSPVCQLTLAPSNLQRAGGLSLICPPHLSAGGR